MMKKFAIASLAIASIVLLAGCQKDGKGFQAGKQIRFTAGNGPTETRTIYSADVVDGFERINWIAGDEIRIWSPEAGYRTGSEGQYSSYTGDASGHFTDYVIDKVTKKGRYSEATLKNKTGNGLVWEDSDDDYHFYAAYPSTAAQVSLTDGKATGLTIAASQSLSATKDSTKTFNIGGVSQENFPIVVLKPDMTTATMLAANKINYGAEEVALDFHPAFTAFEITLVSSDSEEGIALESFTMTSSSSALAGTYTAEVNEAGNKYTYPVVSAVTEGETTNNSITFDLDNKTVSTEKGLTFTVFALPQAIKGLTLEFQLANDGGVRKVDISKDIDGADIEFAACKKHRITGLALPNDVWTFQIAPYGLPWTEVETETNFTQELMAKRISIVNEQFIYEFTDEFKQEHGGKDNHYESYNIEDWM